MNTPSTPVTAIHTWVTECRAGTHPRLVARLLSGWVIMGERQVFTGYCLLIPDPVVPHLNALVGENRVQFLGDMARVGDAVQHATAAVRINYAMFGNVEPALHAHIFPRFVEEPEATRSAQPWAFDWTLAPAYSETQHGDLRRALTAYLNGGIG